MFFPERILMFHSPHPKLQSSEPTNRCWPAILGRENHCGKGCWVTGFDGCCSRYCPCQRQCTTEDLKPIALISSPIFHLRLDQALHDASSWLPCLVLLVYDDLFFVYCFFFNLLGGYVIDGLVCCTMPGNLLVIYWNVWMCSFFFLSFLPLTPDVR